MNSLWGQYGPCGASWSQESCTFHLSQEINPGRSFTLNLELNLVLAFLPTLPVWAEKEKEELLPSNSYNWAHEK